MQDHIKDKSDVFFKIKQSHFFIYNIIGMNPHPYFEK